MHQPPARSPAPRARAAAPLLAALALALPATARAAAEMEVVALRAPAEATIGYPITLEADLHNLGTVALSGYAIGVYLSNDHQISQFDRRVGTAAGADLAVGASRTQTIVVDIPLDVPARTYYFGVIADPPNTLGETNVGLLDNVKGAAVPTRVQAPAADFNAVEASWGARSAAGEVVPVLATVQNDGVLPGEALLVVSLSTNDVISDADLTVGQTRLTLAPGARASTVVWVRLPAGLAPSRYYAGLRIDPQNELLELRKDNNLAVSLPADVVSAALGVETSYLPDALLGVPYVRSLVASGGDGPYRWRLASGTLPAGLTLTDAGLLGGTPASSGTFLPVFEVASGAQTVRAALLLRAHAATMPLQVATTALPPAMVNSDYQAPLAAAGGTPPYAWRVYSGALPNGLALGADGVVKGKATSASPGQFVAEVRDASGNAAQAALAVRSLTEGALAIRQLALEDARAGEAYSQPIEADGGSAPYKWALASGHLPAGLALSAQGNAQLVSGKPREIGIFVFSLRLEDATGQSDRNTYVLRVAPGDIEVLTTSLPDAMRGEAYDEELTAERDGKWRVVSGDLPPGFELSESGHLRALGDVVSARTPLRTYSFLVEVADDQGGRGRAGLSLAVMAQQTAEPQPEGGCASAGAGLLSGALALLALWRRRRAAGALAALLAVLAPAAPARAQSGSSDYTPILEPEPVYPGIPDAATDKVVLSFSNKDDGDATVTLPFPFTFYGTAYTSAKVGVNGYLSFTGSGTSTSNQTLPSSTAPNAVIAPFWDDLELLTDPSASDYDPPPSGPEEIRWQVQGGAPARELVIEWRQIHRYGDEGDWYTFQVRLGEAGSIEFHYAPIIGNGQSDPSATVGIENAAGTAGLMVLPCRSSCGRSDFPAGQRVVFSRQAVLVAGAIASPRVAWAGLPATFSITLSDAGSLPVDGVVARLYLAGSPWRGPNDLLLWETAPLHLDAGQTRTLTRTDLVIPSELAPGPYHPILVVDEDGLVPDARRDRNTSVGDAVRVEGPAPDFVVASVSLDVTRAAPGDEVTATLRLANRGDLGGEAPWRIVLSANDVVSLADRAVAQGEVSLPGQADLVVSAVFRLPADLAPGGYRVGALVNCAQDGGAATAEINPFNNTAKADQLLALSGPVSVATARLPDAVVSAFYSFRLQSAGGDGIYLWQLKAGTALPAGLSLSPFGVVEGVPSVPTTATFVVQVTSNGTETAERELTLHVAPGAVPLAFVTTELPAAIFGREFEVRLAAQGGAPPYLFSLADEAALPQGLAFDPTGLLGGIAAAAGDFQLELRVQDRRGNAASRTLVLHVLPPGRPAIDARPLADALVNVPYSAQLQATGGRLPYTWTLEGARRLGTLAGEQSEDVVGAPSGLALQSDGKIVGTPLVEGVYALRVAVKDAGNALDRDTVLLVVRAERGIAILTSELPAASLGVEYDQALVAAGGDGRLVWSVVGGAAPDGLLLETDTGRFKGVPATVGRRTFVVQVVDEARRVDVRAVSLEVKGAPVAEEPGGCATGGASLLALAGLLGLGARRRRRAAALGLALGAAALVACGEREEPKQPCDGVTCQPGEVCNPADGTCRCGDQDARACTLEEWCNPDANACELLDRCMLVQCSRGMACDPADGVCRCGQHVCGEGSLCDTAAKVCVVADRCALVTCAGGLECDPADGRCRCGGDGGTDCGLGERCVDGACVADPCATIACTGGTKCDPTDRRCKCGGAGGQECLYGQTCTARGCVLSSRCATVRCAGNMSCDPADGACRCGEGGPVCSAGQTCDPEDRVCQGGNRCLGQTCPAGTTCDPEDGACHCGAGGPVCAATQFCEVSGQAHTCRTLCDPVAQTPCGTGEACFYGTTARAAWCQPAGSKTEGAACAASTECGRGMHCVTGFSGSGNCRFYCTRPTGTCSAAGRTCKSFTNAPADLGACAP